MQFIQFNSLVGFVLLAMSVTALAGPPTQFIQSQVRDVRALLAIKVVDGSPQAAEVDGKLSRLIDPLLMFDRMSENALRAHWASLTAPQRAEFVTLFRALVFRRYLNRIRSADEAYTIDYEGEEAKGRKAASVSAVAKTKKAEIELVFHLLTTNGRTWVVEDIVIDEVSLVENYREQFNRIIAKDGFLTLLQKMADKLVRIGGVLPDGIKSVKVTPTKGSPTAKPPVQSKNVVETPKSVRPAK
ncbi:MAG: ABC transporter substrate-binding protein [Myxococcota bacterium]|nr:ABC transporter substrate-binding protein [Myxococcota bacterium]